MRTTLDIDDDVLAAARELARRDKQSIGQMISNLARAGLRAHQPPAPVAREPRVRYGIEPIGSRGGLVTNEVIDRLRGDDIY